MTASSEPSLLASLASLASPRRVATAPMGPTALAILMELLPTKKALEALATARTVLAIPLGLLAIAPTIAAMRSGVLKTALKALVRLLGQMTARPPSLLETATIAPARLLGLETAPTSLAMLPSLLVTAASPRQLPSLGLEPTRRTPSQSRSVHSARPLSKKIATS